MKSGTAIVGGLLVAGVIAGFALLRFGMRYRPSAPPKDPAARPADPAPGGTVARLDPATERAKEPLVRRMCSRCHHFPPPEALPRAAWRETVGAMFRLAREGTGGQPPRPLTELPEHAVAAFYEALAPESFPRTPWSPTTPRFGLRYEESTLAEGDPTSAQPGVSSVRVVELFEDSPGPEVVVCDILSGRVSWAPAREPGAALAEIATLRAPARVEVADLDGDGARDLVVAVLGTLVPTDHPLGEVVWLRRTGPREFEARRILARAAPVSDARAADLDGDGDLDLAVACFGNYTAGRVSILRNLGPGEDGLPSFAEERLDEKDGAVAVLVEDLDGDGRPEVVALHGQEHEEVVVHRNLGGGAFRSVTAWEAPHPAWGASALAAGDLDGDGDTDLLIGNGDAHADPDGLRAGQGILLLENGGSFPFREKRLGDLQGVHGLAVADLDGDGDMDVVASSLLPGSSEGEADRLTIPVAAWWEQSAPGVFRAWPLATGRREAAAMALADLDGDGRLAILLGSLRTGAAFVGPKPPLVRVLRRR